MIRSTWSDYDAWEARERTLLEAFALARELDRLDPPEPDWRDEAPLRYRSPSPAEELPLDL